MEHEFEAWFRRITGSPPYAYQTDLATGQAFPDALNVPTGLGKTAAAVTAWVWRRFFASPEAQAQTPRRLVYVLPMRVLVEQTVAAIAGWLDQLDPAKRPLGPYILMGGQDKQDWDLYPEREAVLVGTQDMLLSRALNRGYGMSRYRWPLQFGLLNNDCLWIVDEVQLMGAGIPTTAQLQAFRERFGTLAPTKTLWMSATLDESWLDTVDFGKKRPELDVLRLTPERETSDVAAVRLQARKPLLRASAEMGDLKALSDEIARSRSSDGLTLVIVNTVDRARELARALRREQAFPVLLLHSRFRQPERQEITKSLGRAARGTVVISTQAIEAGVDLSADVLFTELAPWASLIQRFGRCNRDGKSTDPRVVWLDLPREGTQRTKLSPPYDLAALEEARGQLLLHDDVGPSHLKSMRLPPPGGAVLRSKDLVELFDTTPDLGGLDLDVSRFVRQAGDSDASVFWRDFAGDPGDESAPEAHELCTVPLGDIIELVNKGLEAWRWDVVDERWQRATDRDLIPGVILLLRVSAGLYSPDFGWDRASRSPVPSLAGSGIPQDRQSRDPLCEGGTWVSLEAHTEQVVAHASRLAGALGLPAGLVPAVVAAARWHDAGKAHPEFQASLRGENTDTRRSAPERLLAKSALPRIRHSRKGFRHELASGLLALSHGQPDLVAYLAASHHGKVRISVRSLPGDYKPPGAEGRRFSRGLVEGDCIPSAVLGGGITTTPQTIDLSAIDLGGDGQAPSWAARMLALRDDPDLGPFRLAALEGLIKVADERASGGME